MRSCSVSYTILIFDSELAMCEAISPGFSFFDSSHFIWCFALSIYIVVMNEYEKEFEASKNDLEKRLE